MICLGNICRSPMAEFILKDQVRKKGTADKFIIDSAATSTEEIGNTMHYGTRKKLEEEKIPYTNHIARQLKRFDYEKYDYIIGMEEKNIRDILQIVGKDKEKKVYRLLDFSDYPRDIADPWYTGDFDKTFEDIQEGCTWLLKWLREVKNCE